MVTNIRVVEAALTGKISYRAGWFGRVVMQVEEELRSVDMPFRNYPGKAWYVWRDATLKDFGHVECTCHYRPRPILCHCGGVYPPNPPPRQP